MPLANKLITKTQQFQTTKINEKITKMHTVHSKRDKKIGYSVQAIHDGPL